jgi:hypothetical protein
MKKIFLILTLVSVVSLFEGFSQSKTQTDYVPGEIIVKFEPGVFEQEMLKGIVKGKSIMSLVKDSQVRNILLRNNVQSLRKVVKKSSPEKKFAIARNGKKVAVPDFYNLMYIKLPKNVNEVEFCNKLEELDLIEYAHPNYIDKPTGIVPNDSYYEDDQNGLENSNDIDIDAETAWQFNTGSENIRVGVIDFGVDYTNPDLGGSYGSDAPKVKGGYNYKGDNNNPKDISASSHGTACAGIIGALRNNNTGVAGIAGGDPDENNNGVAIYAFKVGNDGGFPIGNVVAAIEDGAMPVASGGFGCHVLNYSGGGDNLYPAVEDAISFAARMGVIFVASKGNESTDDYHYPSDFQDNLVISVGAFNNNGIREKSFSNYGNNMDLLAPGTSYLVHTTKRSESDPYDYFNGTSASAPMVSGTVALLLSVDENLHRDDIERLIELSAVDVLEDDNVPGQILHGYDDYSGHGMLNAGAALEFLHAPYELTHHTATGGTSEELSNDVLLSFNNDAAIHDGLADGAYVGDKYQVTKTVIA